MDEDLADGLWRQFKETDTAAKRGHGIGFEASYEQQYQEALEKQYPVSSGARQVHASADAGGSLEERFRKAADDPATQPGWQGLSAGERIKARIKYAAAEKIRVEKQTDRHDDAFVTNKKRELAGIGAMVDAQGNMLGTTYSYSAADSADLQGALNAAACTQQRQAEGNHADAIFGAPARRAPERSGGGRARRGESAERGLEVRHEGRPRSPRRHRDREERHARDRRHEYGERRRGGADRCEDLRRGSDRGHRERSGRGSGSRHDARDDIERAGSSRRARDRDDRPRVEQTRNDDHRQARDRSHARGTSPARGRVGESGAGREGPAAELLARGKDGATRGSSAKHRHRDAPSVSVPRHEDGSTRVSNGAAGGEAAFSDVPEAARQQHAEPNADQIAWRQAMAAVPEGATVVLDVDGTSEAKGGADVAALQDVGLDGAFAAAGGSWRDRMRKKAAG